MEYRLSSLHNSGEFVSSNAPSIFTLVGNWIHSRAFDPLLPWLVCALFDADV